MDDICPYCGNMTTFTWKRGTALGPYGERWEQEWDECNTCGATITGADWLALEEQEEERQ